MNIHWMDGLEHYTDIDATVAPMTLMTEGFWAVTDVNGGSGLQKEIVRTVNFGRAWALRAAPASLYRRSFGSVDTTRPGATFGFYMLNLPVSSAGGYVLAQFCDANDVAHIGLQIGTTGRLIAVKGLGKNLDDRVVMGQSTREIAPGTWNHVEVKCKLHASTGFYKVWINGRLLLNLTGINTLGIDSNTGFASQVSYGVKDGSTTISFQTSNYYDDFVSLEWAEDGSEDDDTFVLGQYGVYFQRVNADTATKDWQLTAGINGYALIDELLPDDDAAYIFSDTVGDKSSFALETLPPNILSIAAVMPLARVRKTDTGIASFALGINSQGTEQMADDQPSTLSYSYYGNVILEDPHTNDPWDPLNLPEVVVERTE